MPMNMAAEKRLPTSPDPLLQYVFGMFAILTWVSVVHPLSSDVMFVTGVLQLSLGIAAFVGSILNLQRGDPHGNINLILSVILGFAGGITQIATVYCKIHSIHFHPWMMSIVLLTGGLYMLALLPLLKGKPLYISVEHFCVSAGFLCTSLADLLNIPVLKMAGAWLLFVFALASFYQGISIMYMENGIRLPQGPAARF